MRKINTRNYRLATRGTPREINRQIVLTLIRELQPVSRAELARRMSVRRSLLSTLVGDLVTAGAVYERPAAVTGRGRRPRLLHIHTSDRVAAAADVRPDRTSVVIADYAGRTIASDSFATPSDPSLLAEHLVDTVQRLCDAQDPSVGSACGGLGVVVPGMVDRRTGCVLYAPRLDWHNVDLRSSIEQRFDGPVYVESAPIACALARLWLSPGQGAPTNSFSFAYVSISDGVGVGLVHRGEVLRGEAHTAGEFGHVSFDPNGPECVCGKRGCWEALAGNAATVARYLAIAGQERALTAGVRGRTTSIEDVLRRGARGERAATEAITRTGTEIGRGLSAVISAFNPGRIYLGGEVIAAWNLLEAPIRSEIVAGTLTDAARNTPVVPDAKPSEYRMLGAVALVAARPFAAPRVG